MSEHLMPHQTALPPPTSAGTARDRRRPHAQRVPPAASVVGWVSLAALVIVSALALIATMPAEIVAPTAILLVGGLVGGSLAVRARVSLTRSPLRSHRARAPRRDSAMLGRAPT
jgi:hypothetical protein